MLWFDSGWNPVAIQLSLLTERMEELCRVFLIAHIIISNLVPCWPKHEHISLSACDCSLVLGEEPA